MTEPAGAGGLVDTETALQREVDVLHQRYPDLQREELEHYVRDTYEELKHDAEVRSHLIALTRAQVTEKLRERGAKIHVQSEDDDAG
jgi:hypothetical protein